MHICLFDIDGTLLNSMGAGKAALEGALCEEFSVPSIRNHIPYSGRTDRAIMRDLLQTHEFEYSLDNVQRLIAGYLQRLPDSLKKNQGRVLPGILDLLAHLMEQDDVVVGLLTGNIRAGAKTKLGHFGLHDFFAFGGFGDHHYDRDDVAREAMQAIIENCGESVALNKIWVIGDTPLDVQCARAIGVNAVAVATGLHTADELAKSKPDLLLNDFSDPSPLLHLW